MINGAYSPIHPISDENRNAAYGRNDWAALAVHVMGRIFISRRQQIRNLILQSDTV
jgi:hypothetical protein